MANVENLKIGNNTYGIRDKNTLRSLDSTKETEVSTYGTYDGVEVNNGEVFTSETGKFQEFSKVQESGKTEFTEKDTFPGSTGDINVTRIIKSVGGIDTPFYMAVGDGKCFTSNNGIFGSTPTSSVSTGSMSVGPLYLNGVWVIRNSYGRPSYSTDDGANWTTYSSNSYPSLDGTELYVLGDYFCSCGSGKYYLSQNGANWASYSYSGATSMAYDGKKYLLVASNKLYKTETPTDETSWVLVKDFTNPYIGHSVSFIKYSNGKYYIGGKNTGNYNYYYNVSTDLDTWTAFSQAFGNGNRYTYASLLLLDDIVFIFIQDNNGVYSGYQSNDFGQTFITLTNSRDSATAVGSELWYITGGKIYSLNPNPHWVYSLTDLFPEISDIADAGDGIKFVGSSVTQNFTTNGSPTIVDGIYSNISNSNNIVANTAFQPSTNTWEFVTKITTGNTVSGTYFWIGGSESSTKYPQIGIGNGKFYMAASYTGSNWDINTSGISVSANTTYWIKVLYDGSYYKIQYKTNEEDAWSDGLSVSSSTALTIPNVNMAIGWYYGQSYEFKGSIDLNETYLKIGDDIVWTPYTTVTTDKTAIALDVATNQASAPTSSTAGYVGKLYVTTGGSVYICTGVSGSTYTWAQITTS